MKDRIALGLLLGVAAALRLFHLGSNPPGLFCDEVSIADNAESIGRTGRDLDGKLLPLHPCDPSYEFWGFPGGIVYKPLYSYAMVPWLKVARRSPLVIRIPSVVFGLLGIAGIFVLARHLYGRTVAYWSASLLTVLPWHHQFSRIAFEAISILPPAAFGMYFLFRGVKDPRFLVAGSAVTCLAAYAYPTGAVLAPLLIAGFLACHGTLLRSKPRTVAAALAVAVILALPLFLEVAQNHHQERAHSLLIGTADLSHERAVDFLMKRSSVNAAARMILNSRALLVSWVFVSNYLSYFSPGFLFLWGDSNVRHIPAGTGMCLPFMAPLLLIGIALLWKTRKEPTSRFLLYFLFVYPIPASLTIESPHAIRSLPGALILTLISAVGAGRLWAESAPYMSDPGGAHWKSKVAASVCGGILAIALYQTGGFLYHYHHDYPKYSAPAWQVGTGEAVTWLEQEKSGYEHVYVSPKIFNSSAYVFFFAEVDFGKIPSTPDLNQRLQPYKYRILFGDDRGDRRRRNLWLFPASERGRYSDLDTIREFTSPDGSPQLIVARSGG